MQQGARGSRGADGGSRQSDPGGGNPGTARDLHHGPALPAGRGPTEPAAGRSEGGPGGEGREGAALICTGQGGVLLPHEMPHMREQHGAQRANEICSTGWEVSAKKSLPLSSITTNAGKFSTSMRHTASIPSSGYSRTSTLRMQSWASRAAGPPMEPR